MRNPRLLLRAAALAFGLLSTASAAGAQTDTVSRPVVLDGVLDEWESTPYATVAATRQGGEGGPSLDSIGAYAWVSGVAARHDADAVYLRLRLEREVSLQAMEGALLLLMDADGDSASGWTEQGMRGVDAVIEFSPRAEGWGAGIALRMDSAGAARRRAYEAGVIAAPTHASREFEMRIRRGGPVRFGERMTARVVAMNREDRALPSLAPFIVHLSDPAPRPTPPGAGAADPLARAPGTDVRVVSWNVGREDLFQQPEAFGAILRALAPDLLLLDEVAGGLSAQEVEALLNRILPGDPPWRAVYGVSGGSQRGVIATRGTVRPIPPFDRPIPYPDTAIALVPRDAPRREHDWLRSRLDAHVPATGALLEVDGRRIIAVTVDLESGGAAGGPKDRLRRIEAAAIRDAAREAFIAGTPDGIDGILLAGDLNLVGTREPLDILAAPAGDGPAFMAARPLRLDGSSATTWENPEEPFTPGRLDFLIHHPAGTAITGGFVFSSADLSPAWRARHGLMAETSRVTDHLPVVTDLRWLEPR
jgi:hypothetical protein